MQPFGKERTTIGGKESTGMTLLEGLVGKEEVWLPEQALLPTRNSLDGTGQVQVSQLMSN